MSQFVDGRSDFGSDGGADTRAEAPGARGISWPELGIAAGSMLAAMLASVVLGRGGPLFTQRAWLDEFHTLFVATHGTLRDGLVALSHGADFNPPLLPLVVRALDVIVGGLDSGGEHMLLLRMFSFACIWLGLVALYSVLRRRFDRSTSFIASFALFAHPLVIQHAFEARFYGPWLLLTLLFLCSLLAAARHPSLLRHVGVALSAAALCLIHYYGILTWGLVILAMIVAPRPRIDGASLRVLAPSLLGPIALAGCIPLYLGQRGALSVPTWIRPATALTITLYLALVFAELLILAGAIRVIAPLIARGSESRTAIRGTLAGDRGVRALLMLGLVPVALILFSLLVQPTLIDRFTIVGVVACAPIFAASVSHVPTRFRFWVLAILLAIASSSIGARARGATASEQERSALIRAIDKHVGAGEVVAVDERYTLYPLALGATAPKGISMYFPVLPDSTRALVRNYDIVERDAARIHARFFGFPHLRTLDQLRGLDRFWLVTRHDSSSFAARWFPSHEATRVAPHLRLLRRAPGVGE